jgi:hypothetical protein
MLKSTSKSKSKATAKETPRILLIFTPSDCFRGVNLRLFAWLNYRQRIARYGVRAIYVVTPINNIVSRQSVNTDFQSVAAYEPSRRGYTPSVPTVAVGVVRGF